MVARLPDFDSGRGLPWPPVASPRGLPSWPPVVASRRCLPSWIKNQIVQVLLATASHSNSNPGHFPWRRESINEHLHEHLWNDFTSTPMN